MARPKKEDAFRSFIKEENDTEIVDTEIVDTEIEAPKTYKVEFISSLYSMDWGYTVGTVTEIDEPTYIIAKKYNSIKDI